MLPCHVGDPDLWFADSPAALERAKALCADCPIRRECLAAALKRAEPWGVRGGEIFDRGSLVSSNRPRKGCCCLNYHRVGFGEAGDQLFR